MNAAPAGAFAAGSAPSRLVALLALLLVLALAWAALVQPLLRAYDAADQKLGQGQEALARYRAILERRDELRQQTAELERLSARLEIFLPATSDAQAVATLQELIKGAAAAVGVRVASVEPLPPGEADGLRLLRVRATFSADTARLQEILYQLEGGRPVLMLDELYVRARSVAVDAGPEPLDVRVDAIAFRPGGAGG